MSASEDYATIAAALTALEAIISTVGKSPGEHRDANRLRWREYGQGLLMLRRRYVDNIAFGRIVRRAGLKHPPADAASARSTAMWLASLDDEQFAALADCPNAHPTGIRLWAKRRGFAWAHLSPQSDARRNRGPRAVSALRPRNSRRPRLLHHATGLDLMQMVYYGKALLDLRQLHPNNNSFGRAVREQKLDQPPMNHANNRTGAMWLAVQPPEVLRQIAAECPRTTPSTIRSWFEAQQPPSMPPLF